MSETSTATTHDEPAPDDHSGHDSHEIHLPPNSWVPLSLAGSMTTFFVGFLVHPVVWIVGAVWTLATLAAWLRAAVNEYRELPD